MTIDSLSSLRDDDEFTKFWDEVNQVAAKIGIDELELLQGMK